MATAQPQLNIMLWNTDGGNKISAKDRRREIDHVLDKVLEKYLDNLFIFCQDKVNGPKHKLFSERLHKSCPESEDHTHTESRPKSKDSTDSKRRPQVRDLEHFHKNEEASIYFRCINKAEYVSNLQEMYKEIQTQIGSDFKYTRMQAYVVDGHALLVSWHGPHNDYSVPDRLNYFDSLVRFVERVRTEKKCDVTIVGGDFNIPVERLRKHLSKIPGSFRVKQRANFPNLDVFCDYDTKRRDVIDYVVAWPKGQLKMCHNEVVYEDNTVPSSLRPFDHPIVMYTLQNLELKPIEHIKKESEVVMGPQNFMLEMLSVRKGRNKKDVVENENSKKKTMNAKTLTTEVGRRNVISKDIIHKESN